MEESTGRHLFRMLGDVQRAGGASTVIWTLKVLRDSTVVSGDSLGHVQLWDGSRAEGAGGVLLSTYRQHVAAVLCLAVNAEEDKIFASGVDGKVMCLQRTATGFGTAAIDAAMESYSGGAPSSSSSYAMASPADNVWTYTQSHRAHTHDVFSLAVCRVAVATSPAAATSSSSSSSSSTAGLSVPSAASSGNKVTFKEVLLSGGLDTKLCRYSVDEFGTNRPAWMAHIPTNSLISHSSDYGTVLLRQRDGVDIWSIDLFPTSGGGEGGGAEGTMGSDLDSRCKLSVKMQTKDTGHIQCAQLSPCGDVLVLSSNTGGTRMWHISRVSTSNDSSSSSSSSKKNGDSKKRRSYSEDSEYSNPPASALLSTGAASPTSDRLVLEPIKLPVIVTGGGGDEEEDEDSIGASSSRPSSQAVAFSSDGRLVSMYHASTGRVIVCAISRINAAGEEILTLNDNSSGNGKSASNGKAAKKAKRHNKGDTGELNCSSSLLPEDASQFVTTELGGAKEGCSVKMSIVSEFYHKKYVNGGSSSSSSVTGCGGKLKQAVRKMTFSADGSYLAVCDCNQRVYVYSLYSEDSAPWCLPELRCPVSDVSFNAQAVGAVSLVVLMADNTFLIFDITSRQLSSWSTEFYGSIPKYVKSMPGPLCGISSDPMAANKMLLYAQGFCVLVDLAEQIPLVPPNIVSQLTVGGGAAATNSGGNGNGGTSDLLSTVLKRAAAKTLKSKKGKSGSILEDAKKSHNFSIFNLYRNLLHVGTLQHKQLVSFFF